jgi:curved DNA-binding protein CbpA
MNLYEVLGLYAQGHVDADIIKAAYRRLSKQYHPDKGGDPAIFNAITKAYDVLSNPERRKRYDETGEYEDKPDPIEAGARAQFFAMCEELFFKGHNINFEQNLAEFRKQSQRHLDQQRAENARTRERAEAARERILSTPAENDLLSGLIAQKLEECARTDAKLDEAQAIYDRAYQLWDGYQIDDSKAPALYRPGGMMIMQSGATATGTGWTG